MTEKDTASMTTVQMKADYAASEVYSTASEPPPLGFFNFSAPQAYKRQSNSVKIAKITAFTIIVSSFILGSFILASSYLQAKASCDQVQALDSVLEKELMLETLQQVNKELPRAEALLGRENIDDDDLQSITKVETPKRVEATPVKSAPSEEEDNMNKLSGDSEEADAMRKYPGNVPLELDLSDLAAALLQSNKKSRMNCVVERKHAEEFVDSPSKTVALPFGMKLTTDPKKARITGERISIFCEGGNESKEQDSSKSSRGEDDEDTEEEVESLRPMFIPYQRVPIPFGPIPNRFPLTHMPQRMEPMMPQRQFEPQGGFLRQMPPPPPPFQQLPMRPPMPPQVMQAPHPEPQRILRIQVHQIPLRELIHVADDVPQQIQVQQQMQPQQQQPQQAPLPQQQPQQQQQQPQQQQQQRPDMPFFQIQRMPLGLALERAGITAEDLANIQRMTEDRINEEFRRLTIDSDEEENSNSSEDDDNQVPMSGNNNNNSEQQEKSQQQESQQSEQQESEQQQRQGRMQPMPIQRLILQPLPEQPRDTMTPPMPDHRMPMAHPGWGRSLAQPVSIPVPMMEGQNDMSGQDDQSSSSSAAEESERPHFVHPRSV